MRQKILSWKFISLLVIVLAIPVGLILVRSVANYFGRAGGTKANLIIDLSSQIPVTDNWRNLAQGGEEQGSMIAPVIVETRALAPEYIRLDHIYDYHNVVNRNSDGSLNFNWTSLDSSVNDILGVGARPFFSLSYMPLSISSGSEIDMPNNWGEWQLVVQRTIEHYSGINGGLGIKDVYYEVWNEPDLFGDYKTYGDRNYLDLYAYAAQGAMNVGNAQPFKLGGPATTGQYSAWGEALFEMVTERNLKFDFYSWHRYSTDLDEYERDMLNAQSTLSMYPELADIELIISELGHDSKNHSGYDNNLGAIHTIATAAMLDGKVDRGFIFEIKDGPGPEKYWGRWGILTHEKYGTPEKKPRYYAISFLNQMKGNWVPVFGQGSWVKAFTRNNAGVIKTLVVNYDSDGTHSEAVPIRFDSLPFLEFTLRRKDFLGGTTEIPVATTSASFQTIQLMNPNSAAIFELIPQ